MSTSNTRRRKAKKRAQAARPFEIHGKLDVYYANPAFFPMTGATDFLPKETGDRRFVAFEPITARIRDLITCNDLPRDLALRLHEAEMRAWRDGAWDVRPETLFPRPDPAPGDGVLTFEEIERLMVPPAPPRQG